MNNHLSARVVHVAAWQVPAGVGFDWYETESLADEAFAADLRARKLSPLRPWTGFRFEVKVPALLNAAAVTELIGRNLEQFCEDATFRVHASVPSTLEALPA